MFLFHVFAVKSYDILHISPAIFVCQSACMDATNQEWLAKFSWKLIFESFTEMCEHISILVKTGQQ
jgi:hypothetical protein